MSEINLNQVVTSATYFDEEGNLLFSMPSMYDNEAHFVIFTKEGEKVWDSAFRIAEGREVCLNDLFTFTGFNAIGQYEGAKEEELAFKCFCC